MGIPSVDSHAEGCHQALMYAIQHVGVPSVDTYHHPGSDSYAIQHTGLPSVDSHHNP